MRIQRSRHVVFLVVPPVEELDLVGLWEVFASANQRFRGSVPPYKLELVSAGKALSFTGDSGLTLRAGRNYRTARSKIDTLIVPGGTGPQSSRDSGVLDWLVDTSKTAARTVSICTGAFLLARAGLLDGKRATTHWKFAASLATQHPRIIVEPDRIYVQDGRFYTSAGVTAGMDLALALIEEDLGSAVALDIARTLVLFLRRPGGQNQFSAILSAHAAEHRPLTELQVWMLQNLRQNLSIPNLAARVAMSPRNFARVFARELGVTPACFIEKLRVEECRRMLEASDRSLEEIATASGFHSVQVMRRAFLRRVGISPKRYREGFSRSSERKAMSS
jgi:transcriptional regulator GlxA family with amidase domain